MDNEDEIIKPSKKIVAFAVPSGGYEMRSIKFEVHASICFKYPIQIEFDPPLIVEGQKVTIKLL